MIICDKTLANGRRVIIQRISPLFIVGIWEKRSHEGLFEYDVLLQEIICPDWEKLHRVLQWGHEMGDVLFDLFLSASYTEEVESTVTTFVPAFNEYTEKVKA